MESTTQATCRFCGRVIVDSMGFDYHSDCAESAYQEHLADQAAQAYEDATEPRDVRCVW